jgi:hypothetical protein
MNKKKVTAWAAMLALFSISFSCTSSDEPYRTLNFGEEKTADPDCNIPLELLDESYDTAVLSKDSGGATHPGRTECYLSEFSVPNASGWKSLPGGAGIASPDTYTLSFVELPESGERLPKDRQLTDLLSHLSGKGQQVVMVYVHGWRHDAAIGNGNVRRFRTMLGYARSALNSRCLDSGRYCDAQLTGVYVGWRGRSFSESTKREAGFPGVIGAVPTFWGRQKQSERLADAKNYKLSYSGSKISPIGYVLRHVEERLNLRHGDADSDKMLTMGHSFGGNMLATYLDQESIALINAHEYGQPMEPVLGDLVVLLNPASEARKWTSIQRKLRAKSGVSDSNHWVSDTSKSTKVETAQVNRWRRMFPKSQRPFYISLTASADWSPGEFNRQSRDIKSDYDKATGILFPMGQVLGLNTDREKTHAIGHLIPKYTAHPTYKRNIIDGLPYGVSHEFIVNEGAQIGTSYQNSGNPDAARCGTHNGWLTKAHQGDLGPAQENWDTSYDAQGNPRRLLNNMANGAEVQFRNALYLSKKGMVRQGRAESVAQGRSPFWNMRGLDTAISKHSNFMNFPTFCGINILWLDDATAPTFFRPRR